MKWQFKKVSVIQSKSLIMIGILYLFTSLISTILQCIKIPIGLEYEKLCHFSEIPYYLYISGSIELTVDILVILLCCHMCFISNKTLIILKLFGSFIQLSLTFWASYLLLSKTFQSEIYFDKIV